MVDRYEKIKEILKYLNDSEWFEFTDPKQEKKLKNEIKKTFPNIDNGTLNYILNLIKW